MRPMVDILRQDLRYAMRQLIRAPGFTATSVYAKLFDASGTPYPELLRQWIALALERRQRRAKLQYSDLYARTSFTCA